MAIIGNNADTLLHGLSAFWHRFFRDIGDIQATYEGTEILLGQVYLNFLSDVLNTSVVEAPLFRKEFYKLITIREDQLVFREQGVALTAPIAPQFYGNPGTNRYVLTSPVFYYGLPRLQDTIFAPQASLENGTDYRVAGGELQLKNDPTNPVLPGFAQRRVVIATGGKFTSVNLPSWIGAGVEKGDTLYFSESINLGTTSLLSAQTNARSATIIHVTATHLTVSLDTPMPTFPSGTAPTGFSWRIMRLRDDGTYSTTLPCYDDSVLATAPFTDGQIDNTITLEVNEVSFWAVDAQIDDLTLYKTYGYFFTNPQLSSEAYRALIRGLMQLYILGPAVARLESALNLTAGLSTVREDGEILSLYDNGRIATGLTGELLAGNIFQIPTPLFSSTAAGGYIRILTSNFANNVGSFNITRYISPTQVQIQTLVPTTPDTGLSWEYTKTNVQTVTTTRYIYTYSLDTPVRTDVQDPSNFDVLSFVAFEALTTAIQVTDYIHDPQWWHDITIPEELLPGLSAAQRTVTPQLYPNTLGPVGAATIGDPGFYIGRDEDSGNLYQGATGVLSTGNYFETPFNTFTAQSVGGYVEVYTPTVNACNTGVFRILTYINPTKVVLVPTTTFVPESALSWGYFLGHVATKPYRHNAAFILMDRFLKYHMFAVQIDPSVTLTGLLITDLQKILNDVKPVHTTLYFSPFTRFTDTVSLADTFAQRLGRYQSEEVQCIDNTLKLTADVSSGVSGELLAGNVFKDFTAGFSLASLGSHVHIDVATNPGNIGTWMIINYIDPTQVELYVGGGPALTPETGLTWGYYEGWLIGNAWQFSGPSGGAYTSGTGAGYMSTAIGGADPWNVPLDVPNTPPSVAPDLRLLDRPLYVNMHA